MEPTNVSQTGLGLFGESTARQSVAQFDRLRRGNGHIGEKRRRGDDDDVNDVDDEEEDVHNVETQEKLEREEVRGRQEIGEQFDTLEASHSELRPRTQPATSTVTFESIYVLLLEERAAR